MKERLGYDTGGTIYSKFYGIRYRATSDDVRVITVTGGKLIAEEGFITKTNDAELPSNQVQGTITITGGHFAQNLEQMNWLGEDYECLDNGDGTWKVVAKE